MAVDIQNTFDSVPEAAALTTANLASSGATPSLISGTAFTALAAAAKNGPRGVRATYDGTTTGAQRVVWAVTAETGRVVMSVQFRFNGAFAVDDIMGFRSASAGVSYLHVDSSGKFYAADSAGVGITGANSTLTIPVGSWVRVDFASTPGTTTTNGHVSYAVYVNDVTTPTFTWSTDTANTGTAPITQLCMGRSTTRTVNRAVDYDTFRAKTLATGWLPTYVDPTPTVSVALNTATALKAGRSQQLKATVTDPSAAVTDLVFTQTAGPAVALAGSGDTLSYIVPPSLTATTLTFRVSARNTSNTELSFSTVSHTVEASTVRTKIDGTTVPGYVRNADIKVPSAPTVPAEPVDPAGQVTGTDYVTIQSLNLTNPFSIREAFTKNGGGKVLSIPAGNFLDPDFNRTSQAVINMPNTWRGIVGVGDTSVVGLTPGSSTLTSADIPTTRDGATNPYYLIKAIGGTPMQFRRFKMSKGATHLHGGIQARSNTNAVLFEDLNQFDSAPGNDWTPPGETFGITTWHCEGGATVRRCFGDGNGRGSSLLGFNDTNNILVEDCDFRNAPWGMPTFWKCNNYTTRRLKSYGGHAGINQEQVGGVIEHWNPEVFPGRTNNANAMHFTFQSNNPSYVATKMRIYDAVNDVGLRNFALNIMKSNNYTVGGGSGQLQQDAAIEVYKTVGGVLKKLTMVDMNNTGGVTINADQHFCLFR